MRFARILGPSQGHGTVASAYCQSLAQLRQIRGKSAVDKELNDLYEAVFGVVEEPGRLRTCKKSRSPGQADTMLFDYTDPDTGKVNVESETVVFETPGGRTFLGGRVEGCFTYRRSSLESSGLKTRRLYQEHIEANMPLC